MRKGICLILIGALVFLLGAVAVPLLFILPLVKNMEKGSRFLAPGEMTVHVKEAGRFYLWNVHKTVYNGVNYRKPLALPDGATIEITSPDNAGLSLKSNTSITVNNFGEAMISVGYADIEQPGEYRISVSFPDPAESRVLAFSRSRIPAILATVAKAIGVALLVCLAAMAVMAFGIVACIRCGRARKQMMQQELPPE